MTIDNSRGPATVAEAEPGGGGEIHYESVPVVTRDLKADPLPILSRLQAAGLRGARFSDLLRMLGEELRAAGLPVGRGHLSVSTLHPLFQAVGSTWYLDSGSSDEELYAGGEDNARMWQESPFSHMIGNRVFALRRRLSGDGAVTDYGMLRWLADKGFTDWYGRVYSFGWLADRSPTEVAEMGVIFSWSADRPEGFSDADIALLEVVGHGLAISAKALAVTEMGQGLLGTYLGRDAAAHVIQGAVRRGSTEQLEAVIMYADLRGFTELSERLPAEQVVALLNIYFDAMGEPVEWQGGQILKFLGDGFIATFPLEGQDPREAGRKALAAARAALRRVAGINRDRAATGLPVMALDIVLHAGRVQYGNVGTQQRLDFTVIGPAVNQASRLEQVCKDLDRNLVASRTFRDLAGPQGFASLGVVALRGIAEPQEVFAPDAPAD